MVESTEHRIGAMPGVARWLIRRQRRPSAASHLYCFAHAGGSPGEYVRWSDDLPGVQVWALQLPGRGSRLGERPFTRIGPLVDALLGEVTFNRPFAFFGHSLGALIAFEVARALRARGRERPDRLLLSACPAPPAPPGRSPVHVLPDPALLAEIERRWQPLPAEVRTDPDLMALVLSYYRADIELFETYRYEPSEPLDCPITALVGDQEAADLGVGRWRAHTRGQFDLRTFPGGHFYLRQQRHGVLQLTEAAMSARCAP